MITVARFTVEVRAESADLARLALIAASGIATKAANDLPTDKQDPATRRYEWHLVCSALLYAVDSMSIEARDDSTH